MPRSSPSQRWRSTAGAGWLAGGALACASPSAEPETPGAPDLIVITVDTLRADQVGAFGGPPGQTPEMDALAAGGTRWQRASVPIPRTTPTMASLWTGLGPQGHGAREVGESIGAVERVPALLAQAGYTTLGISANVMASVDFGFDQGFDQFVPAHAQTADRVSAQALTLVDQAAPTGAPMLLWVHYVDPHFPYLAPGTPQDGPCAELGRQVQTGALPAGALFGDRGGVARSALPDCTRAYQQEIAFVDAQIGTLLRGLADRGKLARAAVVLTADHGENMGEQGLFYEHGPSLHDGSSRVPLALRHWGMPSLGPALAPGQEASTPVQTEDLGPTLLDLAGVPVPPGLDGQSLLAPATDRVLFSEAGSALQVRLAGFLRSGTADGRHCLNGPRFSWCEGGGRAPALRDPGATSQPLDLAEQHPEVVAELQAAAALWPPERARDRAARTGALKLVARPQLSGGRTVQLYDLAADPHETTDRCAAMPEDCARLAAALEAWSAGLDAAPSPARSAQTTESLRALGYVD